MMRSVVAAALTACLLAIPTTASAVDNGDSTSETTATVNGRTFGPADGLSVDPGKLTVLRGGGGRTVILESRTAAGVTPMVATGDLYKWSWGTSYVSTQESNYVWYYAKARAMANIYNSKRVVKVTGGYSLCNSNGTRYNSPLLVSNATSTGSSWLADSQERMLRVSDNITAPSTCKTTFPTHTATLISPNVY